MMFDPEEALAEVWERLHEWRDLFPEGIEAYDNKWNDVCGTMANIREALDLPSEVEMQNAKPLWLNIYCVLADDEMWPEGHLIVMPYDTREEAIHFADPQPTVAHIARRVIYFTEGDFQ